MVRPRTGSFFYSDTELDAMAEDIELFKNTGVSGVVFGVLTASGRVSVEKTKKWVARYFGRCVVSQTHDQTGRKSYAARRCATVYWPRSQY